MDEVLHNNLFIPSICREKVVVAALQEFAQRNKLPKAIRRVDNLDDLINVRHHSLKLHRCWRRFGERYQLLNMYQRIKRPLSVQNLVLHYWALHEQMTTTGRYQKFDDVEIKERKRIAYRIEPMTRAYTAGAGLIFITKAAIYWARHMKILRDPEGRLHGNASWLGEAIPFWHGTLMPPRFLRPEMIDAKSALLIRNAEVRRSACEMIGWEKILSTLESVVIDNSRDPQIGTLVEVLLPTGREPWRVKEPARFLMVKCGTGRNFSIRVPPDTPPVNAAQRSIFGLRRFVPPEVRT